MEIRNLIVCILSQRNRLAKTAAHGLHTGIEVLRLGEYPGEVSAVLGALTPHAGGMHGSDEPPVLLRTCLREIAADQQHFFRMARFDARASGDRPTRALQSGE